MSVVTTDEEETIVDDEEAVSGSHMIKAECLVWTRYRTFTDAPL